MAITVDDPGYRDGHRVVPKKYRYDIVIRQDGNIIRSIAVRPGLYMVILTIYTLLQLGLLFAVLEFDPNLKGDFSWGGVVLSLQILHILTSFTFVKENEVGGLLFYGRPVIEVNPGIIFRPHGFLQLFKLPQSPIQEQFPGDPERVFKGTDEEYFKLPPEERKKFVLPIRATTGSPDSKAKIEEESTLHTQMTLEVNFYVRWVVQHFWVFVVRISTIGEANRQFRDSGERVIIEEVSARTTAKVVAELSQINDHLHKKLEKITEDWGVYIIETAMLSPDLTHKVNEALRDTVVEKTKAQQTVVAADATKVKLTREGEGAAAAKEAELAAFAAGAKALKEHGVDGAMIIDLEKVRALSNGKTTVFIDGAAQGATSLLGIGARFTAGGNSTKAVEGS